MTLWTKLPFTVSQMTKKADTTQYTREVPSSPAKGHLRTNQALALKELWELRYPGGSGEAQPPTWTCRWFKWTKFGLNVGVKPRKRVVLEKNLWRSGCRPVVGTVPENYRVTQSLCTAVGLPTNTGPQPGEESCTMDVTYRQTDTGVQVCVRVCRQGGNRRGALQFRCSPLKSDNVGKVLRDCGPHRHWETCMELHTVQAWRSCCCCCCCRCCLLHLRLFVNQVKG